MTFIDQWPANIEAIREHGVRVEMHGEIFVTPVRALHLCEVATLVQPFDAVLLVVKAYDYALSVIKGIPEADYGATVNFARKDMPRWRVLALAHEHSVWTRGELVSYFRLNKMAPPAFDLFGSGSGE